MHAIHLAKVVQGERSAKEKLKVFRFALPSRSLSWRSKEVQGERSAKEKLKVFRFALPSRSHRLLHQKVVSYGMKRSSKRQKPRIHRRKVATVHWENIISP